MGQQTRIQWCDDTVNPTTGCDGCELFVRGKGGPCYAGNFHEQRLARSIPKLYDPSFTNVRLAPGRMAKAARWPDLTGTARPDKPWLDGMPRMIFVSDMADALSKDVPFGYLYEEIIQVLSSDAGRRHIWLWLTKLPSRMVTFARFVEVNGGHWPENLWPGTSITSQKVLKRIDWLLSVPAKVRFLSVEPMWGEVDVRPWMAPPCSECIHSEQGRNADGTCDIVANEPPFGNRCHKDGIRWVICGGESLQRGHDVHPFDLGWARSLRDQCKAAGVPFFLKQTGSNVIDGLSGERLAFKDSHGGDWTEWPEDLRVREVPRWSP